MVMGLMGTFLRNSINFKAVHLLWIFYVSLSRVAMPYCASVYMCLVIKCCEKAGVLALVFGI